MRLLVGWLKGKVRMSWENLLVILLVCDCGLWWSTSRTNNFPVPWLKILFSFNWYGFYHQFLTRFDLRFFRIFASLPLLQRDSLSF
jgi:hypothetical protein